MGSVVIQLYVGECRSSLSLIVFCEDNVTCLVGLRWTCGIFNHHGGKNVHRKN